MRTQTKAAALLDEIVKDALLKNVCSPKFYNKIGEHILNLPPEKREILKSLTSKDVENIRVK